MTARPPRDVRAAAIDRITTLLHRAQHPTPDTFALELLVVLDGAHIGLTDTTPPVNPDADPWARVINTGQAPDGLPEDHPYRVARAAREPERDTP